MRISIADRMLALGGALGPLAFIATFTILGLARPGYSAMHQAISDLGVGEHAWLLNATLVGMGVLMVGLAVAFYHQVGTNAGKPLRIAAAALVALPGIGYAIAGIFPETNPIHWIAGAPSVFFGAIAAFLVAALPMRNDDPWRGWSAYSITAGIVALVLTAVTFYAFAPNTAISDMHLGGLMERMVFLEILAWYVAVGLHLYSVMPR